MIRLGFARDVRSAARSAESLLLVASEAVLSDKRLPRLFTPKETRLLLQLAADAKPGDNGQVASTLTSGVPKRLAVGVLPERVSRYNCPARAEAIQRVVSAASLGRDKRSALVLILDDEAHLVPAAIAVGRAFPLFSAKSDQGPDTRIQIVAIDRTGAPYRIPTYVKDALAFVRDAAALVDLPPSDLHPEALAARAKERLTELDGVSVTEIAGNRLVAEGLVGIHSVGRAAASEPRLLVATYAPAGAGGTHHVALVGKGITFDTGGLHIKARGAMESMKSDMGGAAAVLGAFRLLVKGGSPHTISLVMCLAENAVGPHSYKPDDILRLHSGKTVEINNTDAEGRIVLADGVSYAARVLGADHVFDAATLTGAQMVATGSMHAAVMSNDADIEKLFIEAGYASGDLVHPLPFAPEFYKPEFKSPVADMRNSVKNRSNAQASCAAQFIYNHIEDTGVRWCHVDLAGPAFRNDRGTGFGVALLAEAVKRLPPKKA